MTNILLSNLIQNETINTNINIEDNFLSKDLQKSIYNALYQCSNKIKVNLIAHYTTVTTPKEFSNFLKNSYKEFIADYVYIKEHDNNPIYKVTEKQIQQAKFYSEAFSLTIPKLEDTETNINDEIPIYFYHSNEKCINAYSDKQEYILTIEQMQRGKHTQQLKKHKASTKEIYDWINLVNEYLKIQDNEFLLSNNFCKCQVCKEIYQIDERNTLTNTLTHNINHCPHCKHINIKKYNH